MTRRAELRGVSPQEYLVWERGQVGRHEFFNGEVFAMAGGSLRHNALSSNVSSALHAALRPKGCVVLSSVQKVGIAEGERYGYPDLSAVCGPITVEAGTTDVQKNPNVLVEVLSSSTEQYDRGLKWEGYQRIPSLDDYLLVSQVEPRIEHFRRGRDGTWIYRLAGPGGFIELSSGARLEVDSIFVGVMSLPGD